MWEAGIIPARAGFTQNYSYGITPGRGSSPLARGLRGAYRGVAADVLDHPRSRGVYSSISGVDGATPGSSPLARGLLAVHGGVEVKKRIIPARAGFTRHRCHLHRPASDHPRSRGVYCAKYGFMIDTEGSSPLARGLQPSEIVLTVPQGIIPARAGFTTRSV